MTKDRDVSENELSRRSLGAMSMAAGVLAATGGSAMAALEITESDVTIKTADGTCDAAFIRPASGSYPGIVVWTDAFGLRPAFRDLGKRLAAEGYAVLIPNPYYRDGKAPIPVGLDFSKPADREKLMGMIGALTEERIAGDAKAYVGFLDSQAAVKTTAKIGTQGYCMGGRLTMITAATLPDRVGAGASFHGGGLVTDKPNSPHLLAPKMKAKYYFGISEDDDDKEPHAKDELKKAFAAAKLDAKIDVYKGALHGWCVPDMGERDGKQIYDKPKAEVAWGHLLSLYKTLG